MERRDDPWINMWHQHSSQTPTAALQPQYPILGTSTSAPQPHTPPQHPNLIPQPHTPTSYPSLSTPTSAPQPQYPNLSIPTSALQPQHPNLIPQPQHPNLIPQAQHPKCESVPLVSFSHRYLQSCLLMPQEGQRSSRLLLQHATGTQNCV